MRTGNPGDIDILEELAKIIKSDSKLPDRDVRRFLSDLYMQATGKYTFLTRALPGLSGPVSKDLIPIVSMLLDLVGNVGNSAEFQKSFKNMAKARAVSRKASMAAYLAAGFNKDQAFALVLQDAATTKMQFPSNFNSKSGSDQ